MQFIVKAYDGKDAEALLRRMAARPDHLKNIQSVKERGSVVCAGGIIEDGKPIGSILIMEFESRAMLDEYLRTEPYVLCNVWQDVQVEQANVVIVNDEMVGK